MSSRPSRRFTRRRLLAAAVAAACGWIVPSMHRRLAAASPAPYRPPELPLAAADLYAPHDLAG